MDVQLDHSIQINLANMGYPIQANINKKGFFYQRYFLGDNAWKYKSEKCFTRNKIFISHQRMCTNKSLYLCSSCDKCFAQMKNLFKHQMINIREKLYNCRQFKIFFYTEATTGRTL